MMNHTAALFVATCALLLVIVTATVRDARSQRRNVISTVADQREHELRVRKSNARSDERTDRERYREPESDAHVRDSQREKDTTRFHHWAGSLARLNSELDIDQRRTLRMQHDRVIRDCGASGTQCTSHIRRQRTETRKAPMEARALWRSEKQEDGVGVINDDIKVPSWRNNILTLCIGAFIAVYRLNGSAGKLVDC